MPPPQILAILSSIRANGLLSLHSSLKFVLKILTCGRVTGGDNFRDEHRTSVAPLPRLIIRCLLSLA